MREPPAAAVQGTRRGRAMSQLQFWLHFAALNKVTLRAARSRPPGSWPLPRELPASRGRGDRGAQHGPGSAPHGGSAFPSAPRCPCWLP